jgi:multiple sugar transport system substrate-binding protein
MRRSKARACLGGGSRQALGAALLAAAVLAGGCSAQAAVPAPASLSGIGPITLVTGKVDTSSYLPGLLGEWNAAHPGQRVTLVQLPDDADDQHAQMVANLQTRSEHYDVLSLDVIWTAEFASAGWLVPLSPALFPLSRFLPPAVSTATYGGRLYAIPFTSNAGLLYYRKDILARAGVRPPRTWAELARTAGTIAPRYGMAGYAGQFSPYEGLTVNFAEAVQSAGGGILSPDGTKVVLDSARARAGLTFLVNGFRIGWIPRAALGYDEEASRQEFERGKLLFLRNWPYVYGLAAARGLGNNVAGRFGVVPLPGPGGAGSSSLGGQNLAISAYSRHQRTALAVIRFLTSLPSERQVLVRGSLPPVWSRLYDDPALKSEFPYLPVLKSAIMSARPRPEIANYNQVSLAISSAVYQALTLRRSVAATISGLSGQLSEVMRDG